MDTMDTGLRALLDELHERGREHDAHQQGHGDRLRNLEPETAALISVLARSSGRTRLLEVGTPTGTPPIWLAWAATQTWGRLVSIELDPGKHRMADENLRRAGVGEYVDLVVIRPVDTAMRRRWETRDSAPIESERQEDA